MTANGYCSQGFGTTKKLVDRKKQFLDANSHMRPRT